MPLSTGESESIGSIGGYTLVDRLGSGGMGVVYLGHSASGRQVAVKVVHAQYAQDEEFRVRFRQEIAAARRVSRAFTAPVVDADPDAEAPWMATLYVPGRTLAEIVAEEGPLGGPALRTLALGLAEALRDIHQAGVVHRDLKPSNVLLAQDGPRVIDFGISRAADNQTLTVTGRLIGTPPFMSPEQFASPRDVTAASDVFSLGSLLVYAATGNRPFDGGSPYMTGYQVVHEQPVLDGVPEPLRSIAERCLDKDATARPDLTELHRLFRDLPDVPTAPAASGPSTVARGRGPARERGDTTAPAGAGRRGRRVRLLVALGAALAVTMVSASVYYMVARPKSTEGTPGGRTAASRAAASPAAALPVGWKPWRANLTQAPDKAYADISISGSESGCVSGGSSLYCAGSGFTVAKLDAASGRVQWRVGHTPQTTLPVGVRDGIVYTYEKPGLNVRETWRLVALDAGTGRRVWYRPINEVRPAVLFDGGVLAKSDDGDDGTEFVAFDARTGKDLWRTPAKSSAGNSCTPLALDGVPYGLCTPENTDTGSTGLVRLDPADGTAHDLATLPRGVVPLGTVAGQPLFAVPRNAAEDEFADDTDTPFSSLLRVNPAGGALVRIPLASPPRGSVTLLDGVVYFVRPDGTVTAIRVTDGARLWQRETQIENLSKPTLSTTYHDLFFANRYGRLLALDRATGAARWSTDKLDDPGNSPETTVPSLLLVKDAIVAVAGDTAFSVRPDRPKIGPKPSATKK
ncbi:serine/threonine-protein kinase [Streptomyces sp. NBC_01549]|uniref:serine/threonine-protein kinase n=1 Tax=Streptomyces sp. NBC_01549 TaxID=2975874 RepID=UPI002258A447|nr:serine/threonine-protein kinase [Streptomyces sp. NBC_01549]MCX4592139.1 serine/threonine-protein kinase [Streptomyces sp. NBC_01549]